MGCGDADKLCFAPPGNGGAHIDAEPPHGCSRYLHLLRLFRTSAALMMRDTRADEYAVMDTAMRGLYAERCRIKMTKCNTHAPAGVDLTRAARLVD